MLVEIDILGRVGQDIADFVEPVDKVGGGARAILHVFHHRLGRIELRLLRHLPTADRAPRCTKLAPVQPFEHDSLEVGRLEQHHLLPVPLRRAGLGVVGRDLVVHQARLPAAADHRRPEQPELAGNPGSRRLSQAHSGRAGRGSRRSIRLQTFLRSAG